MLERPLAELEHDGEDEQEPPIPQDQRLAEPPEQMSQSVDVDAVQDIGDRKRAVCIVRALDDELAEVAIEEAQGLACEGEVVEVQICHCVRQLRDVSATYCT